MWRILKAFSKRERTAPKSEGEWRVVGFLFVALALVACAPNIELEKKAKNVVGDDVDSDPSDNEFEHPFNPGDENEASFCETTEVVEEKFVLDPDSISGANVVLILDDSGSMAGEFQKVVLEIQDFIDGITAATDNNYRIGLIFDKSKPAINGRNFYDTNGQLIANPNPFHRQIDGEKVFYFEKETFSKWADMAFARVFMPITYMQSLPSSIPLDVPNSGAVLSPEDCAGMGKYFRPRTPQINFYNTPGCIYSQDAYDITDYFLEDITVNIVTVSDDDLNVNFDRANFDWSDPEKNAYPEIVDLMFKDMIKPLGEDVSYIYHSIVGPTPGGGIDLPGIAHMALTKKTEGGLHDIRTNDWAPLFDLLQEQIIFSEQKADLQCAPAANLEVRFNNNLVDPENYRLVTAQKRVRLLPAAFDGYDPGTPIQVKISYVPAAP